jgi:SagB-type dehydrogenase family enzyme
VHDFTAKIVCVRRYHQQTKHRFERYADGPETLDWAMQPNPFRRYKGTEKIQLPFSEQTLGVGYCDLYEADKILPNELSLKSIGTLLELSMGLSAWKEYQGERWALRCNPSSGNLHPTEVYVITTGMDDLDPGVYHYVSHDHVLEQRCSVTLPAEPHSATGVFIGLSSVFWREAWKYGERAFRYCQLDTGHALAAIRYACALLGWTAELVSIVDDDTIEKMLGLHRVEDFGAAEREHPDLLLKIMPNNSVSDNDNIEELFQYCQQGKWSGTANTLDPQHLYDWPIIDEVAQAARSLKNPTTAQWTPIDLPPPLPCKTELQAKEIIQRRRSAQMFDGITAIDAADFYRILDMLMPRPKTPPWDALPWRAKIHVVLFVHRVNGLDSGLYILLRNEQVINSLKSALTDKLEWQPVEQAPTHLNLYRLAKANAKKAAATLSCHQRIASDSAFSLSMLSEFDAALDTGPWVYKHLYWEAGMLGQVLYLEAEAIGLQGTGIGCFFDDPVHEMLGITDTQFQSVYHFTVGGALNDSRLRTIMPYEHLNRD